MGWMDFLGGVGAAGQRAIPALEERRMRETEIAENRRRYEDTLKQRALDEAFRQQEATRDESYRREMLKRQDRQTQIAEGDALLRQREFAADEFARGRALGREAEVKDFWNRVNSGQLDPAAGSGVRDRLESDAARVGVDPRRAFPSYYDQVEQDQRLEQIRTQYGLMNAWRNEPKLTPAQLAMQSRLMTDSLMESPLKTATADFEKNRMFGNSKDPMQRAAFASSRDRLTGLSNVQPEVMALQRALLSESGDPDEILTRTSWLLQGAGNPAYDQSQGPPSVLAGPAAPRGLAQAPEAPQPQGPSVLESLMQALRPPQGRVGR